MRTHHRRSCSTEVGLSPLEMCWEKKHCTVAVLHDRISRIVILNTPKTYTECMHACTYTQTDPSVSGLLEELTLTHHCIWFPHSALREMVPCQAAHFWNIKARTHCMLLILESAEKGQKTKVRISGMYVCMYVYSVYIHTYPYIGLCAYVCIYACSSHLYWVQKWSSEVVIYSASLLRSLLRSNKILPYHILTGYPALSMRQETWTRVHLSKHDCTHIIIFSDAWTHALSVSK